MSGAPQVRHHFSNKNGKSANLVEAASRGQFISLLRAFVFVA
jgi:hypothetical protein